MIIKSWDILLSNWQVKQDGKFSEKNNAELNATIKIKIVIILPLSSMI